MPIVSIIIPVYNVEMYLPTCINSIIGQTYTQLEIILVDDGSIDTSPQLCDEFAKRDSRIKVIHKQNAGQAAARNDAMDIMTGDYFMFVDSDDFIHPMTVEYCIDLAMQNSADMIQFAFERGSSGKITVDPFTVKSKFTVFDNRSIFESPKNNVILWGKMFSSAYHKIIRIPEGMFNEDDASAWKFYYHSKKIVLTDKQLYYYRKNPNSTMANLKKVPNIEYPMKAYHERIAFFDGMKDKHLSDLSKWRYSKYLMFSIGNPILPKGKKKILYTEFKNVWRDVFSCKAVPASNKVLLLLTLISPILAFKTMRLIRK